MAGGSAAQRVPLERLVVIVSRLARAQGRPVGVDELLALVSYGATEVQDQRDQLRRDVRQLQQLGWDIDNVGGAGETAQYRLGAVDNRLRVRLDPAERFALLRVARLAASTEVLAGLGVADVHTSGRPDGGESRQDDDPQGADGFASDAAALAVLDPVAWARGHRCLLRFRYKGRVRQVHPWTLTAMASGWYLTGLEDDSEVVKVFRLSRMSEVEHDDPGTALPAPRTPAPPALDPLGWRIDEPVVAEVSTSVQHRDMVEAMLGGHDSTAAPAPDGTLRLRLPVSNRAAFVGRLCQLGERVRLDGPEVLRDALRERLVAVADAGTVT